jgi:hypothetical protein
MPSNNGTETISNEKQVVVLDQKPSPLQPDSKPGEQSKIRRQRCLVISTVIVLASYRGLDSAIPRHNG